MKSNNTFKARTGMLPCSCENGDQHNKKYGGHEWLNEARRQQATAFAISFEGDTGQAKEDYYQEEYIRCLNLRDENDIRQLKDYPQDIEVLKKQLGESDPLMKQAMRL